MNAVVEARGIEPEYNGGMRVTDVETLAIAREVFNEVRKEGCINLY